MDFGAFEIPALVVFDLDDTLWFPEMYMVRGERRWGLIHYSCKESIEIFYLNDRTAQLEGGAPFKKDSTGKVFDSVGKHVKARGSSFQT